MIHSQPVSRASAASQAIVAKGVDQDGNVAEASPPPLHDVQEGCAVVEIHTGKRPAPLAAHGHLDTVARGALLGPRQGQPQSTLDQRGQCRTSPRRFPFGLSQEGVIQSDSGSHVSRHIAAAAICQRENCVAVDARLELFDSET